MPHRLLRRSLALLGAAVVTATSVACSTVDGDAQAAPRAAATAAAAPTIPLGKGFSAFPDAARAWVRAHPTDYRASVIASRIASQPTNLWLTGNESFANLRYYTSAAHEADRTMLLTLWNIPFRWDGLSSPSRLTLAGYQSWINSVAAGIKTTRAIVVLEPDALWFYDRLPSAADKAVRIAALRYAITTLRAKAPNARVYVEAGTASGSVSPSRMAQLLKAVHVEQAGGYAVNVSSYAPTARITPYAQGIRSGLQNLRTVANPRYVMDTGRNGAATWDNTWCNPNQQRLGSAPKVWRAANGLDMTLWVKAPGTSDGNCGGFDRGLGSYGGQFLPTVAYDMAR